MASPFLTMELIEAQRLDRLIPPGGFPLTQFFEIAIPLADALTAAHHRNITHRDLKPANVMVSHDGRVKVLDFGVARFSEASQDPEEPTRLALTHEGSRRSRRHGDAGSCGALPRRFEPR